MEKLTMKKLLLLITYAVVLVAVIVKLESVGLWLKGIVSAFDPLLYGFAIAFVLNKACKFFARHYGSWMKGKRNALARALAIITSYLLLLAVVAALMALIIPEVIESIESLIGNLSMYAANIQTWYDGVIEFLHLEDAAQLNLSSIINDALGKALSGVLNTLTNALPQMISATGRVISLAFTLLLSLVFSVYMLFSSGKLLSQFRRLATHYLPKNWVKPVLSVAHLTADTFTNYVSGQIIEAGIIGVLCFIGMCIFRFDYAMLISVIIAVSALVPILGAYVGAATSALLLLMVEPMQAVWFVVFIIILQQLEGNLIYPRVVGTSIGLPGIWVLAAVTVGSSLMGLGGLIICVPVTAVLYTLLKRNLYKREAIAAEQTEQE